MGANTSSARSSLKAFVHGLNRLTVRLELGLLAGTDLVREYERLVFRRVLDLCEGDTMKVLRGLRATLRRAESGLLPGADALADDWLFGAVTTSAFFEKLTRYETGFRRVSVVAYGLLCDADPCFAPIIEVGEVYPLAKPIPGKFALHSTDQPRARLPLAARLKDARESDWMELPCVEFPLRDEKVVNVGVTVSLLPRPQERQIDICFSGKDFEDKNAVLPLRLPIPPFDGPGPPPPSPPSLLDPCLSFLRLHGPDLDTAIYDQIVETVCLAAVTLFSPEKKDAVVGRLVEDLRQAGPAAEGFFALRSIRYLLGKLGTKRAQELGIDPEVLEKDTAALEGQLKDAAASGDRAAQMENSAELASIATDLLLTVVCARGGESETSREVLDLSLFSRTPWERLLREIRELTGYTGPESLDWLALFMMPAGELASAASEFAASPAGAPFRAAWHQAVGPLEGQPILDRRTLISLIREGGPAVEGLLNYAAIHYLSGDDAGSLDRYQTLTMDKGSFTDHLDQLETAVKNGDLDAVKNKALAILTKVGDVEAQWISEGTATAWVSRRQRLASSVDSLVGCAERGDGKAVRGATQKLSKEVVGLIALAERRCAQAQRLSDLSLALSAGDRVKAMRNVAELRREVVRTTLEGGGAVPSVAAIELTAAFNALGPPGDIHAAVADLLASPLAAAVPLEVRGELKDNNKELDEVLAASSWQQVDFSFVTARLEQLLANKPGAPPAERMADATRYLLKPVPPGSTEPEAGTPDGGASPTP